MIENTQRDLNIALMNELALIFDRMGIRTSDVLEAAGTKWNFLHVLARASSAATASASIPTTSRQGRGARLPARGHPRRPAHQQRHGRVRRPAGWSSCSSRRTCRCARAQGRHARAHVQGERARPAQHRIPDIIGELRQFGIAALVHDPMGDADEAKEEYGVTLAPLADLQNLDALVLAVAHRDYLDRPPAEARSVAT